MKKTIIFDFDGVIADSFNIAYETRKMNFPELSMGEFKDLFKDNIDRATTYKNKTGIIKDFSFQTEFAKKFKTLKMDDAKIKALQNLSKKYTFHIITSTNTDTVRDFCQTNKIYEFFDEILGREVEPSKVRKFKMLFNKYNLKPDDLVFVTDTVGDIKEAKEVNIKTIIAVTYGYQDKEYLQTAKPTHLIDSILDLERVL